MAIMHTTLMGIVDSDPVICSDQEGTDFGCAFTMSVKEENGRIQFCVYVNHEEQVKLCQDELIRGSVAVVKGTIDIGFRNISHGKTFPDGKPQVHPILFSDMTIFGEDLHILLGRSYQRSLSLPIRVSEKEETVEFQFDPDIELPF